MNLLDIEMELVRMEREAALREREPQAGSLGARDTTVPLAERRQQEAALRERLPLVPSPVLPHGEENRRRQHPLSNGTAAEPLAERRQDRGRSHVSAAPDIPRRREAEILLAWSRSLGEDEIEGVAC